MDTFGIYGHKMQGDTSLTAQMIQDRFDDLLSNSKNQGQNKVKTRSNLKNSKKKTSTNRMIKRLIEVLSLGRVVSLDRLKRDPHI